MMRLRRLVDAVRQRFKRRGWLVALLIPIVGFLLQMFAEQQVLSAWNWIWPRLQGAARAPVGVVGLLAVLAIVVVTGVLLVLSYWETRPARAKEKPPEIPQIDPQERHDIVPLRAMWEDIGYRTVFGTLKLLDQLTDAMMPEAYWRRSVESDRHVLATAEMELSQSLHLDSTSRLSEIHARFNRMYNAYIYALRWVVSIHEQGHSTLEEQEYQRQLSSWEYRNRRFYRRLKELNAHPGHSRRLRCDPFFDETDAFYYVWAKGIREPDSVEPTPDAEEPGETSSQPSGVSEG